MSTPLTDAARAYQAGTATPDQVNLLLDGYRYIIDKYIAILLGSLTSTAGKSFLSDEAVRVFAYSFRRGGDVRKTLLWVIEQCRRFSKDELLSEVIRTLLECLRDKGGAREFPSRLAKNVSELLGHDVLTENFLYCNTGQTDTEYAILDGELPPPCQAEQIFDDRGIVLTLRERELLRYMSESFNISHAARRMRISRQRAAYLFSRLKKKAQLT